jgi:hypothetical protein
VSAINIVFDGPPGPVSGRFIEVENDEGASIGVGQWIERDNGWWVLRITEIPGQFKIEDYAMMCDHGLIICARCDLIPDSWRPQ